MSCGSGVEPVTQSTLLENGKFYVDLSFEVNVLIKLTGLITTKDWRPEYGEDLPYYLLAHHESLALLTFTVVSS